ncbi:TPA: sigma-70 family RNA polymerase sigma factor [Bacillus mobilis]|uniref:RNA polymerase sigma factor n=1 Tax=Bacillus mobilis TaxID=2026190 RepID=UPI001643D423|nr:sigma-70 family RNA polymerase sigma factor [Bacillus mobilis]MED4384490.1 sigma-70 family RNA polymerase sigma factor [Bacillus mobilis]HDX9641103.1 sigma-70 family RNA polymerase sigma factor [Bacillus mobilis]
MFDEKSREWNELAALCYSYNLEALKEARKIIEDEYLAMDVIQESIIKVLGNWYRFDNSKPFWPWYKTIIERTALNMRKQKKREFPQEEIEIIKLPSIDMTKDSNTGLLKGEFWDMVRKTLTYKQYLMILLRYKRDMNYQQVANSLNITVGTVKSGLYDAHQKLKGAFVSDSRRNQSYE